MFRRIVKKVRSWVFRKKSHSDKSLSEFVETIETEQRNFLKHAVPLVDDFFGKLERHQKDPGNLVGMLGEFILQTILKENSGRFSIQILPYREEILRENEIFYYFDTTGDCRIYKLDHIANDWVMSYNHHFITLEEIGMRFPLTLGRQVSEIDGIFNIDGKPVIAEVKTLRTGSSIRVKSIINLYESNAELMKPLLGATPHFMVVILNMQGRNPIALQKNITQMHNKSIHCMVLNDTTGNFDKLVERHGVERVRHRDMYEYLRENSCEHFVPQKAIPLKKIIPTDDKLWVDSSSEVYLDLSLKSVGETYYTFPLVVMKKKNIYIYQDIKWLDVKYKHRKKLGWYHSLIRRGYKAFINNKINDGTFNVKFYGLHRHKRSNYKR